eukprot:s2576_g1.t1
MARTQPARLSLLAVALLFAPVLFLAQTFLAPSPRVPVAKASHAASLVSGGPSPVPSEAKTARRVIG